MWWLTPIQVDGVAASSQLEGFSDLLLSHMTESVHYQGALLSVVGQAPWMPETCFSTGFHDHRNWAERSRRSYSSNCIVAQAWLGPLLFTVHTAVPPSEQESEPGCQYQRVKWWLGLGYVWWGSTRETLALISLCGRTIRVPWMPSEVRSNRGNARSVGVCDESTPDREK